MQPPVLMYSTAWCPYCVRARHLLEHKGVEFEDLRIEGRMDLRTQMQMRSGRTSVPQIFIGEQHIGGCDELYALDHAGKLDALLAGTGD
ncbi:glutaredoxin 3 [Acidihalobacter ferrooxydans]|uniref:Glutaredoxin n=1 Tax=Acidihalobacter ferrooxydans TaxID=1765967 RepID=A0A1P8UKS7_9GAMM|nr:glutaredoxin 3 [Acidihalobacter ferrooxydans]APZ44446.1 glutaredoxin 3 [Acidihalobacter ferrooxydans]